MWKKVAFFLSAEYLLISLFWIFCKPFSFLFHYPIVLMIRNPLNWINFINWTNLWSVKNQWHRNFPLIDFYKKDLNPEEFPINNLLLDEVGNRTLNKRFPKCKMLSHGFHKINCWNTQKQHMIQWKMPKFEDSAFTKKLFPFYFVSSKMPKNWGNSIPLFFVSNVFLKCLSRKPQKTKNNSHFSIEFSLFAALFFAHFSQSFKIRDFRSKFESFWFFAEV